MIRPAVGWIVAGMLLGAASGGCSDAPARGSCDPNYSGCVPIDSDVDCEGGKGDGPSYASGPVRVLGRDLYDLDRDGDGTGCED